MGFRLTSKNSLLEAVHASSPVVRIRRLGDSETVALAFASETLPDAFANGYVCHNTYLYVEEPLQCATCGWLGHVAAASRSPSSCVRCGKKQGKECTAAVPHCVNWGKEHISRPHRCYEISPAELR